MGTLTNDYRDSQILDLGQGGIHGPFVVLQTGVAPNDPLQRTHLYVLRPDGCWVDFNAYACQGKPEAMDELVFTSMAQLTTTFGRLSGRPSVLSLPVDETGLQAWLERQEGANPLANARAWAEQYRIRHANKS